jgi:zinc D-Ala-D-Ala carboxypeptidase
MRYFSPSELSCKCGCGALPEQRLMDLLDRIREDFKAPIQVTSCMRCKAHNKTIGGAKNSYHTKGLAVDLKRSDALLAFLEANLEKYGLRMEHPDYTPQWIHCDLGPVGKSRVFIP